MAKQLNVNLAFTADTSKARAEINSLQQSLNKLSSGVGVSGIGNILTSDLKAASQAATELQVHLQKAINTDTGTLNFTVFNQSLKNSGVQIEKLGDALLKAGATGQQSFAQLTAAIAKSEVPLRRSNAVLNEFWTTLKNTARWQISSSVLHGFIGAVQGAYGYAKDLNESLNNIRIVTGQSADQMARFAEQANKAAKQLSTTTTRYTDAALIYYQQGLNDSEVKERTDVTVKMANAAGISAQTASDQLTAIWNNFDNGTKSLEHYADVLVKLGAETASSSDEISQGMEKFAAVANTVGLSYEYAAAALATVTATTRQSADTVGTAFKTLFARLEGLQLGETLEDGTDLNKYSKALATVGVDIKTVSGQMKDMDTILDELGAKWQTLGKDQQIALAQTVGGIRQYNQLIALMDNWDFFEQNLSSAKNADGTLQQQADIYAESWEAAANRVRAAQEAIFQDLLKDKGFIGLLNIFEDLLTGVDNFIGSLGGLYGVLLSIGAVATNVFNKQIAQGLTNAGQTIRNIIRGPEAVQADKRAAYEQLTQSFGGNVADSSFAGLAQESVYKSQFDVQSRYMANAQNMSEDEQLRAKLLMDAQAEAGREKVRAAQRVDQTTQALGDAWYAGAIEGGDARQYRTASNLRRGIDQGLTAERTMQGVVRGSIDAATVDLGKLTNQLDDAGMNWSSITQASMIIEQLGKAANDSSIDVEQLTQELQGLVTQTRQINNQSMESAFMDDDSQENYRRAFNANLDARDNQNRANENFDNVSENARNATDVDVHVTGMEQIVAVANAFASLGAAAFAAKGIVDTWNNTDLTFGEKLTSTLMAAGPVVIGLTNAMVALKEAEIGELVAKIPNIAATAKDTVEKVKNSIATGGNTIETIKSTLALEANTIARLKNIAAMAGYLAIAIGIAAAATAMGNSVDASLNSDTNAVSDLTSGLSELETAYSKIASAHSDFIEASSSYDTAVSSLNHLTKGTNEYKEALLQANEAALEMIKNNPNLNYTTDYETGLIKIDKQSKKDAEQELLDQKVAAQNEKIIAQQKLQVAQAELDKTEYLRKNDDELSGYYKTSEKEAAWLTGGLGAAGMIAGLAIAATGGLALLPMAAAGALLGVGLGAGQAQVQKDNQVNRETRQKDALDNIAEAFEKTGKNEAAFSSEEELRKMLAASGIFKNQEQIDLILQDSDLVSSLTSNASETANLMNTILSTNEQLAALNEKVGEDNYGKEIQDAAKEGNYSQKDIDKAEELAGEQLSEKAKEIEDNYFNVGQSSKYARKQQIKRYADEVLGINSADLTLSKDGKSATYFDENNQQQTITWKQARSGLAEKEAKEAVLVDSSALLQSAKEINDQQFIDLLNNIGNDDISNLFTKDKFANLNNEYKTQLATYLDTVKEDPKQLKTLTDALSSMDTSQLEQFLDLIQTTDWPTTSAQEFVDKLVELGLVSKDATDGLAKVIEFLQQFGLFGGETEDQKPFLTKEEKQAEYNKIKGITDSITDQNRKISKENYNQLPQELQKYFSDEDAGGNRYLEGDINAFQDAANNVALAPYQSDIDKLSAKRAVFSNIVHDIGGYLYSGYDEFISQQFKGTHYGGNQIGDQLAFLEYAGYTDTTGTLDTIKNKYSDGKELDDTDYQFLQTALSTEGYEELWNGIPQAVTDLGTGINEAVSAMAMSYEDESELMNFLQQQVDEGNITEEERDSIYDEADEKVGREHAEELGLDYEDYESQLSDYKDQFTESFTNDYGTQLQEAYGKYGDSEEMQMMSVESAEDLIPSQEEIAALAAEHLEKTHKTNEAIDEGKKKYKDLAKTLDKTVEGTSEWEDAMDEISEITADILGVDVKSLSKDFIKLAKDSGKLEKAMNGDKEAINDLRKAAAKTNLAKTLGKQLKDSGKEVKGLDDALNKMDLATTLEDQEAAASEALKLMAGEFGLNAEEMTSQLDSFYNWLSTAEPGEPIPPDFSAFLSAIANAAQQAGMSIEQIQSLFSNFGGATLQVQTEEKTIPGEESTTTYDNVYSYQPWSVDTVRHVYMGKTKATIKKEDQTVTGLKVIGVAGDAPMVKDGGGGGGGGGAKPPKPKKRIDPKVRYEGTQKQIDNLANQQEQVQKNKDAAFGKEKIKQAEKEIELKQRQIKLQTQLMEETKEALELQKIDVADRLKKFTNIEIEFDVDGSVANLDKIEEAILNLENKIIDLENAEADEFVIAAWQEKLDMAREGFDDLLDIIEDNLDAENAFFEAINELAELNLGLIQIKVDLDVSLAEAELEYIDYLLEKLTDEGFEAAEAITILGDKANNALGQIETYRKGIAEILANRGLSVDDLMNMDADDLIGLGFTQAEIDALLEYRSAIIENMSTLNELRAEMIEKVSAAFGTFSEELTRQIDLFEHYSGLLEHFGEIATLTGSRFAKSELRDLFNSIDNAVMANGQANIRAAKSNLDDLRSMYEAYMTSYAEAKKQAGLGENDTIFEYEETRKEMEDALREAEETFYSAWEDTLSKATDILERWVEDAGARFEEVLSPMYQSLDRLEEAYGRMKEQDENYYDNYEQLYHLSQLTRDISNSIDDTDNIKGKQRLRDLMKEITDIQARGVELSEYDVDVLRKRYELEQARQALEDASDNASIVRLQRDQEGNWGYVYTADEDAVDEAEKEYENKLYELQKANDEYIKELQDRILELTTDCKEQLADIAADTTLSPEEKERLSKEISDFYNSQLEYLTSQMDGALANQNATLGLMLSIYDTTKDQLLDTWEETNLSLLGMYNNTGDMFAGLTGAMKGYIEDLWEGIENFDNNLNNTNIAAGSADAFGTLADEIGKIGENTEETEQAVESLGDTFVSEFETIMAEVTRFEEVWGTQIDSAIDKNEEFVSSLLEVISLLALVNTDDKEFTDAYNEYKAAQQKYLESLDGTISPSTIRYGLVETNDPEWEAAKRKFEEFMTQWMAKHSGGIMDSGEAFDTGGYTGEWGPEGRLAWLHQKELILNPVDTENLLDAVAMVKTLELNVGAFTDRLSEVIPSMMTMERGAFQQEIYITAEFTEATSAAEIQEAFENLINDATQYAYSR